jgi:hypothetical protein
MRVLAAPRRHVMSAIPHPGLSVDPPIFRGNTPLLMHSGFDASLKTHRTGQTRSTTKWGDAFPLGVEVMRRCRCPLLEDRRCSLGRPRQTIVWMGQDRAALLGMRVRRGKPGERGPGAALPRDPYRAPHFVHIRNATRFAPSLTRRQFGGRRRTSNSAERRLAHGVLALSAGLGHHPANYRGLARSVPPVGY